MQRYFANKKIEDTIILKEEDIYHIKKVMRNKQNDKIEAVYNDRLYLCNIEQLEPIKIKIEKELFEDSEMNISLTIAVSLVQEQKFDMILQKLTELGVSKIIPVKTERSIVKLENNKLEKKYQRWEKICKEASEQTHRLKIPKIEKIMTLQELAKENNQLKLICSLSELSKPLNEYLTKDVKNILFLIGPEGGFSNKEEEYLINNSFKCTSLGKRILRVETATIYVASIINYIYN